MTLALYGKSRQRQGGLLLVGLLAVLVAMIAGVATITSVFAHHNTYSSDRECDESWSATASYVGGDQQRLIVLRDVRINGAAFAASWESGLSGSFVAYNLSASDFASGQAPGSGVLWQWIGTDGGGTIFDRSGGAGSFSSDWSGQIILYRQSSGKWTTDGAAGGFPNPINISAPSAATNCGKIIIKKVVTGAGADTSQVFTADIVNDDGSAGEGNNRPFSQVQPYSVTFDPGSHGDDFEVTEDPVPANWTLTGKKVLSGDAACPSPGSNDWTQVNGTSSSDRRLSKDDIDRGETFTFCFRNAYTAPTPPKVGLDKDDSGDGTYEIGESFNFRLKFKVSNGPTTQATIATDTIPSQFTVGDVTTGQPAGISCSKVGQDVTCTLAAGAANGTHTALIPVTVAQGAQCGPVTNYAMITENSPHRDPDDYTGDEEVTIPCPQTITLTLRVCKLIDAASGDTAEPFTITVSDKDPFTPSVTEAGEAGKLCKDYSYEVPVNEPTVDVTVNETEPSGWNQPEYTTKDQGGSESPPATMSESGASLTLGQGTCEAVDSSQTSQVQSVVVDVNPDCTVTIINKVNKGEIFIGKDDSQTAPANAVGGATFRLTLGDLDLCVTDGVNPAVANPAVPECANATWVPDMALGAVGTAKVTGLMLGTWHVFEVLEPVGYGPDTCGGERIAPLTATAKSWSIAGPGCTAASPGWTAFHNLRLDREIQIEKHFVNTGGYIAGAGDVPTFVLSDPNYPDVTFASACLTAANGAENHLLWICKVPYDWAGTVTETPADGWEEVKCAEPESFVDRLVSLVQSIVVSEDVPLQRYWEFCNAPYGTVIVNKLNNSAAGPNFTATISGLPATDIFGGSLDSSPTIAQGSPSNQTLVPLGPGAYSVTEVNAGTTETCGSGATNYFTIVQAPADTVLDTPGEIQTWTIVNQPCGVLGQGGLVLEKYRDNNGDGTANGSDAYEPWTIKVTGPGGFDQTFVLTAAQMPFLVGPLAPGNYTVSELTASGWVAIGLRVDNGALVAAATQTTVAVDGAENVLRGVTFYNQPRVNIEVNKTEISLATPGGAPGNLWSFTLNGCGVGPLVQVTGANGKATFSNLPPAVGCSYTVTETVKGGWSAINPVQVAAPSAAGQTAVLNFTNVKIEVCVTGCITIVETPTPTATPETPTATPETPEATATPETPTPEPTIDEALGERTPGPQTPVAPSTGTGFTDGGASGMNMLFALVGLVAISLGTTILALGRKSSRR